MRGTRMKPDHLQRTPMFVLAASCMVLGLVAVCTLWQPRQIPPAPMARVDQYADTWPASPWENARPGVKYVGDAACTRCHADIAETYRHHPMGRSLASIARAPAVEEPRSDGTVIFEAGSLQFTIERRGGREVHRESQLDEQGRTLAQLEADVKYALGSGRRGVSYLVEHDGRLFQSPISWYATKHKWDLSPGYHEHNYHFDRSVPNSCLFCHANRVELVESTVNHYKEPVFALGEAIGCERCHGPGELHIQRQKMVEGQDLTIVNPRHLTPSLRAAVCEQCHLLGDQQVVRLGRNEFDYRPGLPSIAFYAVFGRVEETGVKAVGHVQQMKVSRCFRESEGRLGCTSCHDPHQVPTPQEKADFFRNQCLACHQTTGCDLPKPARLAESPENDCIQCHMPKLQSNDIAHTSITDHKIPRKRQTAVKEPSPPKTQFPLVLLNGERTDPEEPGSMGRELAIALVSETQQLPDTPQARQMNSNILSALDSAIRQHPNDLVAERLKARVLALSGRHAEAMTLMKSVLKAAPSNEMALDEFLTYALAVDDIQAASAPAREAVAVNPWSAMYYERLAYVSLANQNWDGALREAREALRINPFLRSPRMFVVQCLLHQKDVKHAEDEFATLVKLHPAQRQFLIKWFADWRRNYKT
jgi:Flp pilus assembly protein TadD